MPKPEHLFIASVVALRLSPKFTREDGADGAIIYRPRPEVTDPADPINFQTAIVKLLASDQAQAHRLAMRVARVVFPEAQGWSGHGANETLILHNVETFQRGDG